MVFRRSQRIFSKGGGFFLIITTAIIKNISNSKDKILNQNNYNIIRNLIIPSYLSNKKFEYQNMILNDYNNTKDPEFQELYESFKINKEKKEKIFFSKIFEFNKY